MTGKDCLHGSHQEAQKSINSTLALLDSGSLPSSLKAERSGKTSPAWKPGLAAGTAKGVKRVKTVRRNKKLKRSVPQLALMKGCPARLVSVSTRGDAITFLRSCVCMESFSLEPGSF